MKTHKPNNKVTPFPIYSHEVSQISDLEDIDLPSKNFVLFLAADYSVYTQEQIAKTAEVLVSKGLKYVLCWGTECQKGHDAFDLGNINWNEKNGLDDHVVSTWHVNESFEDALWFCLYNALPDDEFWPTTSIIVVSVSKIISEKQYGYLNDIESLNHAVGL